jgi:hypothetical protein
MFPFLRIKAFTEGYLEIALLIFDPANFISDSSLLGSSNGPIFGLMGG